MSHFRRVRATVRRVRRAAQWFHAWLYALLGHRGTVLLMFGAIYIPIGISISTVADFRVALIHTHLPEWFRVSLWCLTGGIAVVTAWRVNWQKWGFAALFCPPCERFLSFTWAVITDGKQWLPGAFLYGMLTLAIQLFASWDETSHHKRREELE